MSLPLPILGLMGIAALLAVPAWMKVATSSGSLDDAKQRRALRHAATITAVLFGLFAFGVGVVLVVDVIAE